MSKKVKIKKAPSGKQLRKIRKSLGIAGEEHVALELLPEDFLGQSAESLYCVYGLSMAPIDTGMFDSTACDWWELVESTKVLFMPPAERVTVYGDLPSGVRGVKLRTAERTIYLNLVLGQSDKTSTANFIFPSAEIDLASLPQYYQKKSSSYHTLGVEVYKHLKDPKFAQLAGPEHLANVTAFAMSSADYAISNICEIAAYILLRLQQTIYCHTILRTGGHVLGSKEVDGCQNVVCVNTEDMMWLSANLPHVKLASDIAIPESLRVHQSSSNALSRIIGDPRDLFSYFATCNPMVAESALSDHTTSFVRVSDINAKSKEGLLLINAEGVPLQTSVGDDLRDARWAVRPTGLSEGGKALYALFTRSDAGWTGFQIGTMPWVFFYLKKHLGEAFKDSKSAQVLSSRTKALQGFTLEAWLGVRSSATEAFMYDCADTMLGDMDPSSLLQSTEDISYFLRILIWRARAEGIRDGEAINTGLLRSDGKFMYVELYNLYGNINFVGVRYLGGREDDKKPLLFYKYTDKLFLRHKGQLTYSDQSLKHVLLDNKLRLGTKLAGVSEVKLLNGLRYSVEDAERRLSANPFYAQPFYDHTHDSIAFFIPFYLERGGEPLAALLVSGGGVKTVYTLEWARQRAVCLGIPLADWLRK